MGDEKKARTVDREELAAACEGSEIAIIGMACRLPGADDIETFWRNLRGGVESLTVLTDEELLAAGVPPEQIADPAYVRRVSVVEGIEDFDARFFGYGPQEVTVMDPQHRLFLECAWEVLEQAGWDPSRYPRPIGVFTGAKTNTYLFNVVANRARFPGLDNFQIALGNDLAAMATRVSYKLDLRGPSYALHTACSTSLVAVHLACQSLLLDECSMAIAGGAAVNVPQKRGYLYQKGGILSPDGSCRTFDEGAAGSNFGNGAGAVLLKRLDDALRDGDTIWAVIRGSATNNDGARKASFTAPGAEGQTAVLLEAMASAGVEAEDLSYIEAHGTATELGDSIEILALSQAFRASSSSDGSTCALGSAKTNLGHLETAAGVAGLIKTALALHHGELPPSLHFERPNPKLGLEATPFRVNAELRPWPEPPAGRKRLAGISSFGIGSTNAHVILEEPPPVVATDADRPWQLLLLSARTPTALDAMSGRLGRYLGEHEDLALADVSFTLALGRRSFEQRRFLVCRDRADAAAALTSEGLAERAPAVAVEMADRRAAFLLPGLGEHYVDMGLGLYQREPVFRREVDRCAEILRPLLGVDLREVLYPCGTDAAEAGGDEAGRVDLKSLLGRGGDAPADPASARLDRTLYAQPALFLVEHALAQLLLTRGVKPQALLGYSLGEYVCACLAGVLSLEDALRLVAHRAALIERLPAGAMLAVNLGEQELAPRLAAHGLSLAAVNGTGGCVAAGPVEAVAALEVDLAAAGIVCRRLATTHAFHSSMMAEVADELTAFAATLALRAPSIPYVSNVTGTWITDAEATDPAYWSRHLVSPVRFADGIGALLAEGERALVEVGPGQSLTSFARLHPRWEKSRPAASLMRSRHGRGSDAAVFLGALGGLWQAGVTLDWTAHFAAELRRRVPLPTYPFEKQRYWIDPDAATLARSEGREAPRASAAPVKNPNLDEWLYRPVWRSTAWPSETDERLDGVWLLGVDPLGVADALAELLTARGAQVVRAVPGEAFSRGSDRTSGDRFTVRPGEAADWEELLGSLGGRRLARVVHLFNLAPVPVEAGDEAAFRAAQELGFYSLIALTQALVRRRAAAGGLEIDVVSHGVHSVNEGDPLAPERSTLLGPALVIPQEHPQMLVRAVDVDITDVATGAARLLRELAAPGEDLVVVHRGEERRVRVFEPAEMPAGDAQPFRNEGVYLITGGLGGIGLNLAEHLARTVRARLVLTRRTPLPQREEWDGWLESHGTDDRTSQAITRVRALEADGAEVLVAAADVADEAALRAVVEAAEARFGPLNGVIHAAGILAQDSFKTVQLTGRAECELHFGPKAYGLYTLARVLGERRLDFVTLYSSLSAILGGLGYVGYATANLFMDYFAERQNAAGGTPWRSVDWDSWHHTDDDAARGGLGTTLTELAMTPQEGVAVLSRLLAVPEPRPLVISTGDLAPRLAQWVEMRALRASAAEGLAAGATRTRRTGRKLSAGEELETQVAGIWQRVLGVPQVGREENFFDLGGNSLLGMQLVAELGRDLGVEVEPVALFESPTVSAMARYLSPEAVPEEAPKRRHRRRAEQTDIAVIGLSGRFPGAATVDEFWRNLREGRETITVFSDDELRRAGVDDATLADPRYVKARPTLEGVELFDAPFFGYTPREAEIMDPQHRIYLESAWAAFEDAGYDIQHYEGAVGVYAGASLSSYMANLYSNPELVEAVGTFQTLIGNEKDSLTTKVSYNMNLRGPSLAVQTFCSTSLVAVHLACQALINGECDMALAGGVSGETATTPAASARWTATSGPSTPRGPASSSATAWATWCSSGWTTHWPTAIRSAP
jgi:acyl transferase domain-containing protein